jgi:hypothetical protein
MGEDRKDRGGPERERINLAQRFEARYWSEKFGVSEEQLIRAFRQVGPFAGDVERHLRKKFSGVRK